MAEIDRRNHSPEPGTVDAFPDTGNREQKLREFAATGQRVVSTLDRVNTKYTKALEDISADYAELTKYFENLQQLATEIGVPLDRYPMNFCYGAELLKLMGQRDEDAE